MTAKWEYGEEMVKSVSRAPMPKELIWPAAAMDSSWSWIQRLVQPARSGGSC